MVWLWRPCKCDTFLKRGTHCMGHRQSWRAREAAWLCVSYRLWGWHDSDHPQLTSHSCHTGCAGGVRAAPCPPARETAGPGFAREEVVLRGTKWRPLEAAAVSDQRSLQQFFTSSYGFPVGFLVPAGKTGAAGNLLSLPYQP